MTELLYLAHRIPYPPNKGDKIRSFNFLRHLASVYKVHLGAFIDAPEDRSGCAELEAICEETCFEDLSPLAAKLRSATGLLNSQALSIPYYASTRLQSWVADLLKRRPIERIFVFSSPMAQYATAGAGVRRVVDFCDIDSDKWRQYAGRATWPMSWVYRREARLLAQEETRIAESFDASLLVSEHEARQFREQVPAAANKIDAVRNGVDTVYFDPRQIFKRALDHSGPVLVFTGAMDYWANVDAVCWFVSEVLPAVRAAFPTALFCIVGSNPTDKVRALAEAGRVVVTGSVPDVRPYLAQADVAVAPLRMARGVQNKVLEAMSMARAVVATPAALDGLDSVAAKLLNKAESGEAFAQAVVSLLKMADRSAIGRENRRVVVENYGWGSNLDRLVDIVEGRASASHVRPLNATG